MLQGVELVGAYLEKYIVKPNEPRTNTVFAQASPKGSFTVNKSVHVYANTYVSTLSSTIDQHEIRNYTGSVMHNIRGKRKIEGEFEVTFPNNFEFTTFMTYILNQFCHIVTPDYVGYGIPREIRALDHTYDHNLTIGITIEFDEIAQKEENHTAIL